MAKRGKKSQPKRKSRAQAPVPDLSGELFARIAAALERIAPPALAGTNLDAAEAFIWQPAMHRLTPVKRVNRVGMSLLKGVDRVRDLLLENTERFARGLPANNAL